jgi:uncharacterized membrane protein
MSDTFDDQGRPALSEADESGIRLWGHIMYAMHAVSAISGLLGSATVVGSFLFSWLSVIAIIINFATRGQVRGSWLESHWRWQLRTFWFAVAWGLLAAMFAFTVVGLVFAIPILFVLGAWILYRVLRGWWRLKSRAAMPL